MDIKNNECVSGKSGKRNTYSRLKSVYGNTPLEIAVNLKKDGYTYLYIADLDKIEGISNNDKLISDINGIIPVILDNGITKKEDLVCNKKITTYSILATETIQSIDGLIEMIDFQGAENTIVSIDIKDNKLLIANKDISLDDLLCVIKNKHVKNVIILNISNVGTKNSDNNSITEYIIKNTPDSTHILAGGITNETIHENNRRGISNFLIGTILHEGLLDKKQ